MVAAGGLDGLESAVGADAQGGDSVPGVVDGAGGTGEVEDEVDLAVVGGLANIFFDKLEARIVAQMRDVGEVAGDQIVGGENAITFGEQAVTEMRAEKSGSAGDEGASRFFRSGAQARSFFVERAAGASSQIAGGRPTL